jgi:hypothetical protein
LAIESSTCSTAWMQTTSRICSTEEHLIRSEFLAAERPRDLVDAILDAHQISMEQHIRSCKPQASATGRPLSRARTCPSSKGVQASSESGTLANKPTNCDSGRASWLGPAPATTAGASIWSEAQ